MARRSEDWEGKATYTITGDICTLSPAQGAGCSFLAYEHFRVGSSSGWLSGYWRDPLMPNGKFHREPLCQLPFARFEVLEQSGERLVLRIAEPRANVDPPKERKMEVSNA